MSATRPRLAGCHLAGFACTTLAWRVTRPWDHAMASSTLIGILVTLLVIILVLYLVQRLPIESRMRQIVQIIVIIIGIVSLLRYLAVF
jgi:hypothetical protein